MGNKKSRDKKSPADWIQFVISYFLRLTLIGAAVWSVFNQRWMLVFVSLLILFLTFLPSIFERRTKILLPIELEFFVIVFIYASLFLGDLFGYYNRYWWWDVMLHTASALALGFVGFIILYTLYYKHKIRAGPFWLLVFSFSFALAIGALWEIFEFGMDQIFSLNMQRSGLLDTMWDLIVDTIGALLISLIGFLYIRKRRLPFFTTLINKFFKKNPRILKK